MLKIITIIVCLCAATHTHGSTIDELQPGHWLEVRGNYHGDDTFAAEHLTLVQPDDEVTIIGTIRRGTDHGLTILDRHIELTTDTKLRGVRRSKLEGQRVKVEGELSGDSAISVETLSARGVGRERLEGPIESISRSEQYYEIVLLGYRLLLISGTEVSLEDGQTVSDFARVSIDSRYNPDVDHDDDRFGDGIRVTDTLRFTARVQSESIWEDNFNFDDTDNEDRQDLAFSLRSRLEWEPDSAWQGVFELRYRAKHREQQDERKSNESELQVGEAFVTYDWLGATRIGIGRQDFDDEREWLFDENLDALRVNWNWYGVNVDASVSKIFSDDGTREEDARNTIVYVSNGDDRRHIAAYWLDRDFAREHREKTYHYGVRAYGRWLPSSRVWLEISRQDGERLGRSVDAWAIDIGGTWYAGKDQRWYTTLGFALATGDDLDTSEDESFRQTGLQDNTEKLGGVTSFRYYGELSDPELSNLQIATVGVGLRITPYLSVDLLGHHYRLRELGSEIADAEWDDELTGENKNLGWEADMVFGYRGRNRWEVEGVFGYFDPGAGFEHADNSWFGKLQVKFRY